VPVFENVTNREMSLYLSIYFSRLTINKADLCSFCFKKKGRTIGNMEQQCHHLFVCIF